MIKWYLLDLLYINFLKIQKDSNEKYKQYPHISLTLLKRKGNVSIKINI